MEWAVSEPGNTLTVMSGNLIQLMSTTPMRTLDMTIRATWAFDGQTKTILGNWHSLWCLLFGPLYYLVKGMWLWALLSLLTANGLWLGFPLFNRSIVLRHFHRKGWVQE